MRGLIPLLLLVSLLSALPALESGWQREPHVVIDGGSVRAIVPRRAAAAIDPYVRRADQLYRALAADAGYRIEGPLWLWFGRDSDLHNGFSTVVPFPLIQVELAPGEPDQQIFAGGNDVERTLIHELTHHLANDRNHGFRGGLEAVFGRVLPNDPLSMLVAYFSLPPHVFQPAFWQEGIAIWSETAYAPAESVWGGRGRDPLTHMQWRLDAAAGGIPPVGDWRLSYHRWPYGGKAYTYGAAYLRYLSGAYPVDPWALLELQARQWPFLFNQAPLPLYGKTHAQLIAEARAALMAEQSLILQRLERAPLTATTRLTPPESLLGAPAWLPDGRIAVTLKDPYHRARLHLLEADDRLRRSTVPGHFQPDLRATAEGYLVGTTYDYRGRAQSIVVTPDGGREILPTQGIQPDLRVADDWLLVTAGLGRDLRQTLHGYRFDPEREEGASFALPQVEGAAWSPTWRPGAARELLWVETDDAGSRLVLADLDVADSRRVLLQLPGRILHPAWTADGSRLFFCADHSGVANAYQLALADDAAPRPVTHVIGGVIACVPSPDGSELAVIDHDAAGPYLARLSADPATWAERVVPAPLAWPAPIEGAEGRGLRTVPALPAAAEAAPLPERPYRGLALLRPRYWTPTTAPVPSGGWGIAGLASDPLFTHIIAAGLGVGPVEAEPVGLLSWVYRGAPAVDFGALAWRGELSYRDEVVAADGREFDYAETRDTAELFIATGKDDLDRDWFGLLRIGLADWSAIDEATEDFAGETILSLAPFEGEERYLQVEVGYDDRFLFPDGYTPDSGVAFLGSFRHSGFEGELERNVAELTASAGIPVWRAGGHQLHLAGRGGWSDGDRFLQGSFSIGGAFGLGLPRGYIDRVASGRHIVGGSVAYRLPLWRPFNGLGSTPFVHRALILEAFFDGAQVSSDHPGGDGDWFRSYGGLLYTSWEFFGALIQPGLGVAQQLDGDEDTTLLVELGFRW